MNYIRTYYYEGNPIRIFSKENSPWFVLEDVYHALRGDNKGAIAGAQLEDYEMDVIPSPFCNEKECEIVMVNTSGLHSVICQSGSEVAKPFKHWLVTYALPIIHKVCAGTTSHEDRLVVLRELIAEAEAQEALRAKTQAGGDYE